MSTLALALLSFAPQAATPPLARPEGPARLVTVDVGALGGFGLAGLQAQDFDVIYVHPGTARVDLIARDRDLVRLARMNVPFSVEQEDLESFYASRLDVPVRSAPPSQGASLTPAFGSGSMGGYYTLAEVESVLDQITALNPSIVSSKFSIGTTIEGRDIWALKISDNHASDEAEPEVRIDSVHHAREPQSLHTSLWFMLCLVENYGTDPLTTWIVDNREVFFVPIVNPDGYFYNETTNPGGGGLWRKNRRDNLDGTIGVDLNRNYAFEWGFDDIGSSPSSSSTTYRGPSAASEPEVQAMQAFIDARQFVTALTCHSFSNIWLYPPGYVAQPPANDAAYAEISALATEVNGYPYGPSGVIYGLTNGTTDDYDHGVHGIYSFTPEIGSSSDGFWPATARIIPLAQENELALTRTVLAAGAYVHAGATTTTDSGDMDGNFEPGESVLIELEARNSGDAATATDVTLGLASSDPNLTLLTTAANLGPLASFSSADNKGTPLVFSIAGATAPGTKVDYEVTLSWEGYTETFAESLLVGEPVMFVEDDVELDLGWEVGLVGDTATTGLWEHGDPVGTLFDGQSSNPEDDGSSGGVNCFTTGNGSTSAGGDDVDDGLTTLITPELHLADATAPVITYRRWYADLSVQDDAFQVSISNDGGMSWVEVETLNQTANTWTDVELVVSDHVTPTDQVVLRFVAEDDPNNSIVEAAVDDLRVVVFDDAQPCFNVYGRGFIGTSVHFNVTGLPGEFFAVYGSFGQASIDLPLFQGTLLINPALMAKFGQGLIPADGHGQVVFAIPNDVSFQGFNFYMQALTATPGLIKLSDDDVLLIE